MVSSICGPQYKIKAVFEDGYVGPKVPSLKTLALIRWIESMLDYENIAREIMEHTLSGTALHDIIYGPEYDLRFEFQQTHLLPGFMVTLPGFSVRKTIYYRAGSPTTDQVKLLQVVPRQVAGYDQIAHIAETVEEGLEQLVAQQGQRVRWYQYPHDQLMSMRKTQAIMAQKYPAFMQRMMGSNERDRHFVEIEGEIRDLPSYPMLALGGNFVVFFSPDGTERVECKIHMYMRYITPKLEILQQMPVEMRGPPQVWEKLAQLGLEPGTPYETLD